MERIYGAHLCYGPPIEGGFYYDMWSDEQKVSIIHGYYKMKTRAAMLPEKVISNAHSFLGKNPMKIRSTLSRRILSFRKF